MLSAWRNRQYMAYSLNIYHMTLYIHSQVLSYTWEILGWLMPPCHPKNAGNYRNSYRTKARHNFKLSSPDQNTSFCSRHRCKTNFYIIIWFWFSPKFRYGFLINMKSYYNELKEVHTSSVLHTAWIYFLAKLHSFFLFFLSLSIILRVLCSQKVNRTH